MQNTISGMLVMEDCEIAGQSAIYGGSKVQWSINNTGHVQVEAR